MFSNLAKSFLLIVIFWSCTSNPCEKTGEADQWAEQAERVTIIRDHWGVPHIYGKSDADAVFGLLYAQCEDDFNRVEMNYINAMGRLAEVEGETELYRDLRMKLFIDPEDMKSKYQESPDWLKRLMDAYAAGINYYLHTHPDVKPKLITRFEPWMALTFSEGSIGGDIERVSIKYLADFYGEHNNHVISAANYFMDDDEPRGSNGFSISPSNTLGGKTLFLINPHTTFFFRSEVHMVSEEGLNAYGAITWGQFFVYQGFNERLGWMHTSSRADAIDEYLEKVVETEEGMFYEYGGELKRLKATPLTLSYISEEGMKEKEVTVYHSHHGPVIRKENDRWVSIQLMQEPVKALIQSYLRTKALTYEDFRKTMEIRTNSSNNTVYADADGNIAYFHGNFIPRRDTRFDWTKPLDGSNPDTDWKGLHSLDEMVTILNPESGWIQNCNSTPFTAAGEFSPKKADYPGYMAPDHENYRGLHAVKVLQGRKDFTMESLIEAAYDPLLTGFEVLLPALFKAYEPMSEKYASLKEPMEVLEQWDYNTGEESVATSLAVYWGLKLRGKALTRFGRTPAIYEYMEKKLSDEEKVIALQEAVKLLNEDFGTWKTPWGEINRYQRITPDIQQPFNDDEPSLPVGFSSGRWGALAAFESRKYPDTRKMYGRSGNSFVAFVEFGDTLRAKSISTGGQSGDPVSPHFNDQALMYTQGKFKDVLYYKEDVEKNAKFTYHPGER